MHPFLIEADLDKRRIPPKEFFANHFLVKPGSDIKAKAKRKQNRWT